MEVRLGAFLMELCILHCTKPMLTLGQQRNEDLFNRLAIKIPRGVTIAAVAYLFHLLFVIPDNVNTVRRRGILFFTQLCDICTYQLRRF